MSKVKQRYIKFVYPPDKKDVQEELFSWKQILPNEVEKLGKEVDTMNLPSFAPLGAFHDAFLRGDIMHLVKQSLIEIELPNSMKGDTFDSAIHVVWLAEIVNMAGYYIYGRWLGAPCHDSFWIHACSQSVHPCGFTQKNKKNGYILHPPHHIAAERDPVTWTDYVLNRVHMRFTLPDGFDERRKQLYKSKYEVGDRVEMIHEEHSTSVIPAVVDRIMGRRVQLRISRRDVDEKDFRECPNELMWRDQGDDLIFYVGFASENGFGLIANQRYRDHAAKIAKAIRTKDTPPYAPHDVSLDKLKEWKDNDQEGVKWEKDMVLEIMDRLDSVLNVLKPARVLQVMQRGYLRIGPEGNDIEADSFPIHQSSPMLFPTGYAAEHGIQLLMKDDPNFKWANFLKQTRFKRAPDMLFHDYGADCIPFLEGMAIEAVDQAEKVICPAKIKAIKGRMLHVTYDGWDSSYDQIYDYRSPDLLPCGFCEMHGFPLQQPKQVTEAASDDEPKPKKSKK